MNAGCRWVLVAALLLMLVGCGGETEETAEDEPELVALEAESREPPAEPAPEVSPMDAPVTIEFDASLSSDRRLMVEGQSNLPEGTRLRVVVERELSGVRWQQRTTLAEGRFRVGPLGPGSGFPDGGYRITVNLPEATVQPEAVRRRIGEQGEHLSGPLVGGSRHGLGQVASASRRFLVGSEPRRTNDQAEVLEVE